MATVANGTQVNETTACTYVSIQDVPVALYPMKTENGFFDDDVDDDDDEEEGEDDAGSLVDFIVNDDEENEDIDDGNSSIQSEKPATQEEAECRDMDGIDTSNIIVGKRTRRQTKFYEQEVFNTDEYRKMMLCDVPKEEMHAVIESDEEESENDEEDDASYDGECDNEEEEEVEDGDESGEEDEENEKKFKKQRK